MNALDAFLQELDEVSDQILVGGLARPTADLFASLTDLAHQADALGATTAAAQLQAIADATDPDTAWDATQRLLAWRRLFGRRLALDRVEQRMAADAEVERPAPVRPSGFTGRISCHGFDLDAVGRLTLFGTDIDGGASVVVRDRVSDHDPDDPLGRPAISRLFQASISIRRLLVDLLSFEDHPFALRRGQVELAPAFRDTPALLRSHRPGDTACCALSDARLENDGWWVPEGAVEPTDALRLNLTKLAFVDPDAVVSVALRPVRGTLHVMHAFDPDGARVFPAHDPALYRPVASELAARTDDARLRDLCERLARGESIVHLADPPAAEATDEQRQAWRRVDTPLPTPAELLDHDVATLDLPRLRVAQTCASALVRLDGTSADALLCAAAVGVLDWLVA